MRCSRGFTMLELMAAAVVTLTVLALTMQFLGATASARHKLAQQTVAFQETANLLEAFTARPWSELTADAAGRIELPASTRRQLPEAAAEVEIEETDDGPPLRRIAVELTWREPGSAARRAVRLTAWRGED